MTVVRKEVGSSDLDVRTDKGEGGQFFAILCGRLLRSIFAEL